MTTPDVVLSFVLLLYKTRRSIFRLLFSRINDLKKISVWDIGESGGFFHQYDNQHEKCFYTARERPASYQNQIQYFPEKQLPLDRPQGYNFINKTIEYPLLKTDQIIICPKCSGSGQVFCLICMGTGTHTVTKTNSKGESYSTIVTCWRCGGSGKVTCRRCEGEGELLTYKSKDYVWKYTVDKEPILFSVTNRYSVRSLIVKTHMKGGSYPIKNFAREDILQSTGVYNESIEALAQHARNEAVKKEKEIKERFGIILFQKCERFYVPLGFMNLFVARRFGQYFVAGNIAHRSSNLLHFPWSFFKFLGWLAIGTAVSVFIAKLNGSFVIDQQTFHSLKISLGIAIVLGLFQLIKDLFLQWPNSWIILDDDGFGGWLFVHLMVQAISLTRKGRLLDPCYTDLFHLPEPNTQKSRNSFFCSIKIGQDKRCQIIELFLVSQRALTLFGNDIQEITKDTETIVWVTSESTKDKTDNSISTLLKNQLPEKLQKLRLILIARDFILSVSEFPQVQAYLSPEQIFRYSLPLSQVFEELQQGKLSPEMEETLNVLVDILQPSIISQEITSVSTGQLIHQGGKT